MGLKADAVNYRECASADRALAEKTKLAKVRDRALRSAERWDELAEATERAIIATALREATQDERRELMASGAAAFTAGHR